MVGKEGFGLIGALLSKRNPPIQTAGELKTTLGSMQSFGQKQHNIAWLKYLTSISPSQLVVFLREKYGMRVLPRFREDLKLKNINEDYGFRAIAAEVRNHLMTNAPETLMTREEFLELVKSFRPKIHYCNKDARKFNEICTKATTVGLGDFAQGYGIKIKGGGEEPIAPIPHEVTNYLRQFLLDTKTNVGTTIEVKDIIQNLITIHTDKNARAALTQTHDFPRYFGRRLGGQLGLPAHIYESKPEHRIEKTVKAKNPKKPKRTISPKLHFVKKTQGVVDNARMQGFLNRIRKAEAREEHLIKSGQIKRNAPDYAVPTRIREIRAEKRKRTRQFNAMTVKSREQAMQKSNREEIENGLADYTGRAAQAEKQAELMELREQIRAHRRKKMKQPLNEDILKRHRFIR